LIAIAVAAVGSVLLFFLALDDKGQDAVVRELPKLTYQFLLIAVLGAFLKDLLDQRTADVAEQRENVRARAAKEEALDAFRTEMLQRTVNVTNPVRRLPLLVGAERSYDTYDEQMRAVIDGYLDLRALRHDVENVKDSAFAGWDLIRDWLLMMEAYLEDLIAEFRADDTRQIAELQQDADDNEGPSARRSVWLRLRELDLLSDMLRGIGADPHGARGTVYYGRYLKPYEEVLGLMRRELVRKT
jgi:hypothetical protein